MTRTVRARRTEAVHHPLYSRALRLRHLAPSGLLCFVFLEGAVVLGILLALAELVSWWGVIVLPVTVALMVKFNDLVAGAVTPRPAPGETTTARATVLRPATMWGYAAEYPTPVVPSEAPVTEPEDRPAGYGSGGAFPAERAGSEWARSGHADDGGVAPRVSRIPQRATGAHVPAGRSTEWAGGYDAPGSSHGERSGGHAAAVSSPADEEGYATAGSPFAEAPAGYAASDPLFGAGGYVADDSAYAEDAAGHVTAESAFAEDLGGQATAGSAFAEDAGGHVTAGSAFADDAGLYASGGSAFTQGTGGGYAAGGSAFGERAGGYAPTVSNYAPTVPNYAPTVPNYAATASPEPSVVGYPGSYSRGLTGNRYSQADRGSYDQADRGSYDSEPGDGHAPGDFAARPGEEPRGNSASGRRPWADQLDVRQQMARQAASRRYE